MGTLNMKESGSKSGIQLLTIIGEIEGHDSVPGNTRKQRNTNIFFRDSQTEKKMMKQAEF